MGSVRGVGRPRVRPALRRVAIVAFALLLPVAAHSAWDYIEVRRLVHEIERIREKREPESAIELRGGARPGESGGSGAGRYYLAGGMLALGTSPWRVATPVREALAAVEPDEAALQQLAVPLQVLVADAHDALRLADSGAALDFEGLPPGSAFNYRTSSLLDLSNLLAARTLSLSLLGRADEAVDSVIVGLRLRRVLPDVRWMTLNGPDVDVVLGRTEPSVEALERLQAALQLEDRPEQALDDFLAARARYIDMLWRRYYGSDPNAPRQYSLPMRSFTETLLRPWFTHHLVTTLREWARLVEVVRLPWPEKAGASRRIVEEHDKASRQEPRNFLEVLARPWVALGEFSVAVDPRSLIVDRCSVAAVAVERFRRDHGGALPAALTELVPRYLADVPVDPYSGTAMLFLPSAHAYTTYSVGSNQQDDGGDLTSELEQAIARGWGRRAIRGADIGVRVRIRH